MLKDKDPSEFIDKKWIIKLLFKPIEKIKILSQYQLNEVIKKYLIIGEMLEILTQFKNILFEKHSNKFIEWIKKVNELEIKELDSYINGVKNDYDSILNPITLERTFLTLTIKVINQREIIF